MQTTSEVDMRNKQKSEAEHRRFDKLFRKISKQIRSLDDKDQAKMIKLIIARFYYNERLRYEELNLASIFSHK